MYADMAFYNDDYIGKPQFNPESEEDQFEFKRLEKRASEYVDLFTMSRSHFAMKKDTTSENLRYLIKMATCAAVEELKNSDDLAKIGQTADGARIRSESNDGFSVSYELPDDQTTNSAGYQLKRRIKGRIEQYLTTTGLMYTGVPSTVK